MTAVAAGPALLLDDRAPAALTRRVFRPTTAAFAAVAVLFLVLDAIGVALPLAVQAVPFALSLVLFGLPHGALDHLVPARLDPGLGVLRSVLAVVALYAVLGGATALLWAVAPLAGFVLFLAVTWFHWGQGDLWVDRATGRAAPSRLDAGLTTAARGSLPMLLPLVFHPAAYTAVIDLTVRAVAPDAAALPPVPVWVRAAALGVVAGLVALHLAVRHLAVRHRNGQPVVPDAVEIGVLALFFAAVPPVLAVGLYFTFWHAVRHIARLALLEPGGAAALARGDLLRPLVRFTRDALPITIAALVLLAALAVVLRSAGLGTYLVLIAALTTPHAVVVAGMDRARAARIRRLGAWRTPRPPGCSTS